MKTRIYKTHGQTTTVEHDRIWKHLIIDCGAFWIKHDKDNNTYREGMYDDRGYFTSLSLINRSEFIILMKRALKNVSRIINK